MKYALLLSCLLSLQTFLAYPQSSRGSLQGSIKTTDGHPIAGATIYLEQNGEQTISDIHGAFTLRAAPGQYRLKATHLGKKKHAQLVNVSINEMLAIPTIVLEDSIQTLDEYIITGSLAPQSLKRTVYQVRVINQETIRLRGATNVQTVLNTELGIRFSNDLTLGTSDIQLLGMSGQNVKILLDGIPMLDRGATRESLGQIDINTVERIEIVEGPMSVMYGTDALAGVINIISKQAGMGQKLNLTARIQEESAGKEYKPMHSSGTHNAHVAIDYQHNYWRLSGGLSRNEFGGWQGNKTGRAKAWMPKQQYLGSAGVGYKKGNIDLWYRFNGTDEDLQSMGNVNTNNQIAADKNYLTTRWFHQAQGQYKVNERLQFSMVGSFTDYSRTTQSTNLDLKMGKRTLSAESGSQDRSTFKTSFGRATSSYRISDLLTFMAGLDITYNRSTGARILTNAPSIMEYALFLSPEIELGKTFQLRPGLRFIKNSEYAAPPLVPSLNSKLRLKKWLDLRLGYARGFRSPDLRELYFSFFDASHSIQGNPDLAAERSHSFNGSLTAQLLDKSELRWNATLGVFYNNFQNLISTAVMAENPAITTYINIAKNKTRGGSLNSQLAYKQLAANVGLQYVGRYNQYEHLTSVSGESSQFSWTPEINTNVTYRLKKTGTTAALAFKHTGRQPLYELEQGVNLKLIKRDAFTMADISITQPLGKNLHFNGGIRNIMNITNINSGGSQDGADAHSTGTTLPLSYGRSYFLGLTFNWTKPVN